MSGPSASPASSGPPARSSDPPCLVLTTTSTEDEAQQLALQLVQRGLAACVQLQAIRSVYRWQEQVCQAAEWQLQIKTREALYPALEEFLRQHHSYQTPEILLVSLAGGNADYLDWMRQQTGG